MLFHKKWASGFKFSFQNIYKIHETEVSILTGLEKFESFFFLIFFSQMKNVAKLRFEKTRAESTGFSEVKKK